MNRRFSCDSINFWDGSDKPADELRNGLSSADKIRASLSFLFGIICGLGTREWKVDPHTGKASGNPSLSPVVGRYMVALKKRKALSGETPQSARAITPVSRKGEVYSSPFSQRAQAIMKQLYMFNRRHYESAGGSDNWTARLLQCAYTIANLCLLRFDEVLHIRMQDIRYVVDGPEGGYFLLTLPKRKTFKFGRVPPFPLWPLESDEAHMCPYRALCEWLSTTGHRTGYLFPRLTSDHRQTACMGETPKEHLSASVFLEMFRINLLQVGVDYSPYGTHSFRRGGCQYLIVDRRWNIRRVCEWGGWSTTYSHLTIVKYIISVADEPMSSRADFFRPGGWVTRLCRACGRSCGCNS
ncbi:DNA breaking-rejoining enzyme [Schizophyllum commune]